MYILYILLALVVLLMMVTIHEFGHYCAGKLLHFKINEFSIGFGKSLFSRTSKKTGEIFSIRLVPLGGYCAFEGEEGNSNTENSFEKMAPWKRLIVLAAGPLFNILSAVIFSIILLCAVGYDVPTIAKIDSVPVVQQTTYAGETLTGEEQTKFWDEIESVVSINDSIVDEQGIQHLSYIIKAYATKNGQDPLENSYNIKFYKNDTAQYGEAVVKVSFKTNTTIEQGDVIWKVDGTKIDFAKDNLFSSLIQQVDGDTTTLTIKRNGKFQDVQVNLFEYGVGSSATKVIGIQSSAYRFTFFESLARSVPFTFGLAGKVLQSLWQLITGQIGFEAVGGPLTTITTIADYTQTNFATIFILLPLIAVNLGVFNLLPIPALDGSKMVFVIIEWIRGKPINPKVENAIYNIGFVILMALVVIADLYHFFFAAK